MNKIAYDADFSGWAAEQSALLRGGRFAEADIENIAQEIESARERRRPALSLDGPT
jgi:hypothetical protein